MFGLLMYGLSRGLCKAANDSVRNDTKKVEVIRQAHTERAFTYIALQLYLHHVDIKIYVLVRLLVSFLSTAMPQMQQRYHAAG